MIRKFRESDTESIIAVWRQASAVAHPFLDEDFMEKEERNTREMYIPNTDIWVYEANNSVVGFIAMMGNEVGAIFLKPEYHGQGIGASLMNQVAQMHEALEVEVFEKNTVGRAFYDKYGFKFMKEHIHKETNFKLLRLKYEG